MNSIFALFVMNGFHKIHWHWFQLLGRFSYGSKFEDEIDMYPIPFDQMLEEYSIKPL